MAQGQNFSDVKFLTVSEVADVMRVSKMTVYRLVHSGELPAVRFGHSYRVPESAVAGYVQSSIVEGRGDAGGSGSADTA
ncbi:helix-turn-helix domain-containing protein [Arthrobacter sp. A5]|uniref:helix-turn-helix domain-containing protein n=1 Tax=Arthrobacter sp. A5 TaxID=576926 RepID=UPI003DAA3D86